MRLRQFAGLRLRPLLSTVPGVAAGGRIEDRHRLYLALVEDRLADERDVAAIPVKAGATAGAGVATLGQISTVRRAPAPAWTA